MRALTGINGKQACKAIGLMSGTSVDGIDAALVEIRNDAKAHRSASLLAFQTVPFPDGFREEILDLAVAEHYAVDQLSRIHFVLGELFADAAAQIADSSQLDLSEIDFIGSHGQTIRHLPEKVDAYGVSTGATLQLGELSVIAQRTGVVTVGDFRPADMSRGGQGAPLVPMVDLLLFGCNESSRGLLNIGGIANITVLPAAAGAEDVLAFDTGPGNMVIDAVVQELFDVPMDKAGEIARRGVVAESLLNQYLEEDYYFRPPPKSTGRESYGSAFAASFITAARDRGISDYDIVSTGTELTVQTIHLSYERFIEPGTAIDELIVSGGGAMNRYILERLGEVFAPVRVVTSEDHGMPSDAKEAVAFAVLANETIFGRPGNLPGATGADRSVVLGKICIP